MGLFLCWNLGIPFVVRNVWSVISLEDLINAGLEIRWSNFSCQRNPESIQLTSAWPVQSIET